MTIIASRPLHIRPELADLAVPIDSVQGYPGNPRRGDIPEITDSLLKHGQYAALLVQDSTGYVVKGNNTLIAMRELGYTTVAVHRLQLTDEQALQILLRDNKTSDDAEYDDAELARMLADLPELDGTGWSPDELDKLLRETDLLGTEATAFLDGPLNAAQTPPVQPDTAAPATALEGSEPAAGAVPTTHEAAVAAAAAPVPQETVVPAAPTVAGEVVGPPPPQYVVLSWTTTVAERERVRAAIQLAQTRLKATDPDQPNPTAVQGLLAIADHYRTTMGETA